VLVSLALGACSLAEEDRIADGQFIDNADFDDSFDGYLESADTFEGSRWLVVGDSISVRDVLVRTNYEEYVGEWLGCEVTNVAAGGTGYMNPAGQAPSWLDALQSSPAWPDASEVDFITVMGALNDAGHPLGDPDDRDASTFYGALHLFYVKLAQKYPGIPVGVITSTPRNYCHGEDGPYEGYIEAVRTVAARFGLALLDLYRESGLEPWTLEGNEEYFVAWGSYVHGDGIHPNTKGQFKMAKLIYPFIVDNLRP
jgi:lysophospholipase L1-like esterase